jgi:hypothetical protein
MRSGADSKGNKRDFNNGEILGAMRGRKEWNFLWHENQ